MTSTLPRPSAPPTQRLEPPPRKRLRSDQRHWVPTAAVFAAVMLTSLNLNSVVLGWTWLNPVAFTVGCVLLVMGAARSVRLPGLLVPAAGLVALVGSLVWQFFPAHSVFGVFPGEGSAGRLTILLDHAENTVVSQVAPVLPGTGIFMAVCAGMGLIAILADTLATTLRMPATSGLALFALLVIPAVVLPQSVGVPGFVAAVMGYLLILGCSQWRDSQAAGGARDASGGRLVRGLSIGAAALVVTVVVPLAVPGFNVGAFPQGARVNLWGTATGLNPVVTLGNDLRNPNGFGRITYATDSPEPLYLRAVTLEDFGGQRWEPDQRYSLREPGVEEMGTGEVRASIDSGVVTTTRVTTDSFTSPWLLAPYAPVGFSNLSGRWAWDPLNHSIIATDNGSTAQQQYDVLSAGPELTRERLQAIGPVPDGAVDAQFLALPDTTPGIIRETAESLTANISNPYEQALAIQNFLRGQDFIYSVDAPVEGGYDGSSLDVIARFLESRSGYCVHYAGAMAVMARLANIPSRVAVGYAPGDPTGESEEGPDGQELTEFSVTSRDAHAWPELYFDGVGWVKFEPTPSRGVVPDYAQTEFVPGAQEPNPDDLTPGGNPVAEPGAPIPGTGDGETPGGAGPDQARETSALITAVLVGAVLLLFVPLLLRTLRRRNRRRRFAASQGSPGAATIAWSEATDLAADYDQPALPTDTPRTFVSRLAAAIELDTAIELDAAPAAALGRLRTAYEAEKYSDPELFVPAGAGGRAAGHWDDVELIARALRDTSSRSTRTRARLLPRSLARGTRSRFRPVPRRQQR
ncbi:transglutaminase family protein [Arthrobacter sp. TMN-50]